MANILITGATSGIGKVTAIELARDGAHIIFNSRNPERGEAAQKEIIAASGNKNVTVLPCDLASLEQIKGFAEAVKARFEQIDLLINNAGLMQNKRRETQDGFEMTVGVNHLAHFYLTGLLWEQVLKAEAPRVITVSSLIHTRGKIDFEDMHSQQKYNSWQVYGDSKMMNVLFSNSLHEKLKDRPGTSNSLHPGVVGTGFVREMPGWVQKAFSWLALSPEKGAATTLKIAQSPEGGEISGEFWRKQKVSKASPKAMDMELAQKLWAWSEKEVGLEY